MIHYNKRIKKNLESYLSNFSIWLCCGMSSLKLRKGTKSINDLLDILELANVNLVSCTSKCLRDKAAVSEGYLITNAIFATCLANNLLKSSHAFGDKVFCPSNLILLIFFTNSVKNWQVVQRLDT